MDIDKKKIVFIHGMDDSKRNIKEGMLEEYGDFTSEKEHIEHLLEYVNNKYPDKEIFKIFNKRYQPESVAYILTEFFDDIVFFNTTKYVDGKPNKYGYNGIFMLPRKINEKTCLAAVVFAQSIEKYNVDVIYDLKLDEGVLVNDMISDDNLKTPEDKIKKAIEIINADKKAKNI